MKLFDKSGAVYLKDDTKLANITFGTYYRLAVEYDARNKDAKTVRVFLLDDNSRVIASGNTAALPATFQGENNLEILERQVSCRRIERAY